MDFMSLFPLLILALSVTFTPAGIAFLIVRRRRQRLDAVRQSARAKMEAFHAAKAERTLLMDFSSLRIAPK